jgi:hypothetical protein
MYIAKESQIGLRVVNSGGMCVARLGTVLLLFLTDKLRNETHVKYDSCETGTGKGKTISKLTV